METPEEIYVVTASGSGHLSPCIELCKLLISINYKPTLVIPSTTPSSTLHHLHPLISIICISVSPGFAQPQTGSDLEAHLSKRGNGLYTDSNTDIPVFAIIDFPMGWTKNIFWKFNIQVLSFFTFGACAAAMEWGAWKSNAKFINRPGEVHSIPGLPKEMNITYSDITRQASGPKAGDRPPWVPLIEGSIGLIFNTCHFLEDPFLDYIQNQLKLPIWGVGPLLPKELFDNTQIRKLNPSCEEDEIIEWLNQKSKNSVLYVCFGSQVSPTVQELTLLANALDETEFPFIWIIQNSSISDSKVFDNSESRYGDRGLVIKRWAPQLLILSHSSTCSFLSHCGWNSTMEAIAFGVPILAWPIRGDQFYNSKLVVNRLKIGFLVMENNDSYAVVKDDILQGLIKIMSDEQVQKNAVNLRSSLCLSFQSNLDAALDSFNIFMALHKGRKV